MTDLNLINHKIYVEISIQLWSWVLNFRLSWFSVGVLPSHGPWYSSEENKEERKKKQASFHQNLIPILGQI